MAEPNWIKSDYNISLEPQRQAIVAELERGPVIIEHWHYYGGSAPTRVIVEDVEDFDEYLAENAKAGDAIHTWSFANLCLDGNELAAGKIPNAEGLIPDGGAY
ncbi:MAG: hypothetical protein AAF394_14660 [Planctomycetota bacterium]